MLVALKLKKAFGSSSQKMQLLVTPIKVKHKFYENSFHVQFWTPFRGHSKMTSRKFDPKLPPSPCHTKITFCTSLLHKLEG